MVTARPASHSTRKLAAWQEAAGVPALLLLLTLIYFWPQVGQGRALYWGDIGLYFTPMAQFLHDNLRAGRLPLWNPLILCGAPYVGNPQTWPLYPLYILLPLVPAPYFLSLTVAVHVWLAGLGTYVFLRRALACRRGRGAAGGRHLHVQRLAGVQRTVSEHGAGGGLSALGAVGAGPDAGFQGGPAGAHPGGRRPSPRRQAADPLPSLGEG